MISARTTTGPGEHRDVSLWLAGELLGSSSLEVDSALVCIATACTACDAPAILGRLDAAAVELFGCASLACEEQAERVGAVLTNRLGLVAEATDCSGLLIDRALASHHAHPILIAALGRELARRAGLHSYVCRSRDRWWTAILAHGRTALVGNSRDARPIRHSTIRAVCPHQLAAAILDILAKSHTEPWSARARQLERMLPDCAIHEPRA